MPFPGQLVWPALVAACQGAPKSTTDTDDFSIVLDQLDGSVNAVFAASTSTVWAVGGRPGRALILRYDGTSWVRMEIADGQELNWIWGASDDALIAVGNAGAVMLWDGLTWSESFSGTDADLHGVWGSSADDVWIVGGSDDAQATQGVILLRVGAAWAPSAQDGHYASQLTAVWGNDTDRWIVGHSVSGAALILTWQTDAWVREPVGIDCDLSGIDGRSGQVFAAGGDGTRGIVLTRENGEWAEISETAGLDLVGEPDLTGVSLAGDLLWVSGEQGYVASAPLPVNASSLLAEPQLPTDQCLRGVWANSIWGEWLFGGGCPDETVDFGVVLHRGQPEIAGGPVQTLSTDSDAGSTDGGGSVDAPPPLGPGEECPTGFGCRDDLICLYFQETAELICTHECDDISDCDEFGESCCDRAGCQFPTVCIPTSYEACGLWCPNG